tara:strand:- start:771 stop:1181 length:411 start_codon:yes stop_codon:yes gene_type:complete
MSKKYSSDDGMQKLFESFRKSTDQTDHDQAETTETEEQEQLNELGIVGTTIALAIGHVIGKWGAKKTLQFIDSVAGTNYMGDKESVEKVEQAFNKNKGAGAPPADGSAGGDTGESASTLRARDKLAQMKAERGLAE